MVKKISRKNICAFEGLETKVSLVFSFENKTRAVSILEKYMRAWIYFCKQGMVDIKDVASCFTRFGHNIFIFKKFQVII